jgi:Peptidase family C25
VIAFNKIIAAHILFLCLVGLVNNCFSQSASVLGSGNWFKFSVTQDGVVKIDYNLLRNAGLNPDQINPKRIKIFSGSYGMLPQSNSSPRKEDLIEIPVFVSGEADDKFNSSDYILFFAKGPDQYQYDVDRKIFHYENNLFSDKNFYFLTISANEGKRIINTENINGTFPLIQTYDDFAFYETEKYNLLKSGRQWFGEQFDASTEATIRFDISGIADNSDIKLVSQVMAQSITNTSFQVSINNTPVLTQPINAIPNSSYGIKGRIKADTISFSAASVGAPGKQNQDIKYQFTKGGQGISVGYLDFFLLSFKRKLALYGDQTILRSAESILNSISSFEITPVTLGAQVWDISNPDDVMNQTYATSGSKIIFSTTTNALRTFIVFNPANLKGPVFEAKVSNQNLHQLTSPELIIITNSALLSEAQRLASHRQSHSGISTLVVTTEQIYNEYSGAKQDITALRDFIRDLHTQPASSLKNVLLFGRGSYDYKNRVLANTNLVPIYESRNSLSPLETYSSDDYYGFLEESEGDWMESPAQNHSLDIGVGRLPLKNIEEAHDVVDKLIEYDLKITEAGSWQNEFLFVADDGDFNIHQNQADQLANSIEQYDPVFNSKKFYLDSFDQVEKPNGQFSPDASKALDLEIRKGALIVNYTGHGSEQVWMDERTLDETIISKWKQAPKYPLFVTATCEFGRHDDPFQITSGEKTLLQKKGGSIGLVTTARPVNSSTNFTLNKAFYESLFTKENNQFRELGNIFRDTKNKSMSGVANRNFSLLADPSMKLALPENEIIIDEMKTASGSTQLKALSNVIVKGHIEQNNLPDNAFTGELSLTLFDGPTNLVTKGDENPPFTFTERNNLLFKGKAFVSQGVFQLEFIMPENTPEGLVTGKVSTFASTKNAEYAGGSSFNNLIGGLEEDAPADNTPPAIELFLGDTTFISGGKVGPNTKIVTLLSDNSGINISSTPSGNDITAQVDQNGAINLNAYYESKTGTYKNGMVTYPLDGLEKGKHTLILSASDTYNNRTTATVDFVVTDGTDIQIEEFNNYPNPFYELTTLEFTHSRPGEDLEVFLTIFDLTGKLIVNQQFEVLSSQYRVTLSEWDGRSADGAKLARGVYVGKLSVRSLLDGSKNEQITKLIILN